MANVLTIDAPTEVRALLANQGPALGLTLQEVATREEAIAQIDANGEGLDVLVIGPEVTAAVALPQRLYRRHGDFAVVLLTPPDTLEARRAELAIAPYVGSDAQCVSAAQPASAIFDTVRRAAQGTERRRRYHRTLEALSVKLAAAPVPEAQPVAFLDRLFELAPVAIMALDEGHRVRLANRRASEIFGARPEQLVEVPLHGLFAPADRAAVEAVLNAAPPEEGAAPVGSTLTRRSGGQRQVLELRAAPLAVAGGTRLTLLIADDVTEQARSEEERTALIQKLDAAVRVRDEFLSVASHELKTPLTSLRLQLELISRTHEASLPAPVKARVDTASRQVGKLTALVDSLLDVSRIGSGTLQLDLQEVDLSLLVQETVDRLQGLFAQAHCEVRLSLPQRLVGTWDAFRLEQVLVNLLSNAAKYGAGHPVDVELREEAGMAILSVTDRGIGIEKETLARLFNRFSRGVSERNYGGLGLGLYISRQIVTALNGEIRVRSEPGAGSTFEVHLPLK